MTNRTATLKLLPPGLIIDRRDINTDRIIIHAHGASGMNPCPTCGLVIAQPSAPLGGRRRISGALDAGRIA